MTHDKEIKPDQLKMLPPRRLQEIALDLLQFPMDLPEGERFSKDKRKTNELDSNLNNFLKAMIHHVEESRPGPSLFERLTAKKPPKILRELPPSPEMILHDSQVALEKLLATLEKLAEGEQPSNTDKEIIRKLAYPITMLCARVQENNAAEYRAWESDQLSKTIMEIRKKERALTSEEAHKSEKKQNERDALYAEGNARNLRGGIKLLFEELASTMQVSLDKGRALS